MIAPVRDYAWTREKAIAYAEERDLPIDVTKRSPFSIDQNLWGRAVETGFLEDLWNAPTKDVYSYTSDPTEWRAPDDAGDHLRGRRAGRHRRRAGDGAGGDPASSTPGPGPHGVGRLDMVEDRLVGIKSREIYEAPGAIALITAHQELESVTVERDLARYKRSVEQRWTELVYDGLWFSPLKRALDAFVADSQRHVTGEIRIELIGGRATVTGRRSAQSLYDFNLATYDAGDTFDQSPGQGLRRSCGGFRRRSPRSETCLAGSTQRHRRDRLVMSGAVGWPVQRRTG